MPPRAVINHDESIGKTVGRRVVRATWAYAAGLQRTAVAITERPGLRRVPRGVFRFRSHEEADAWMMHHLTRPKGASLAASAGGGFAGRVPPPQ